MKTGLQIKICGLNTPEAVLAARGASHNGFVFYPPSPRSVSPRRAGELARDATARRVAVVVDPDDGLVESILEFLSPDFLQLHGHETPDRARDLADRYGVGIMKALRISAPVDVEDALIWDGVADALLFDARPPAGATLPGGNGASFDWTLLADFDSACPWFLSGGLDAASVRGALETVSPDGVDVSSGVEDAPGVKNPERIRAFIATVQGRPA